MIHILTVYVDHVGSAQVESALQAGRGIDALCSSPAVRALQAEAVNGLRCAAEVAIQPAAIECDMEEAEVAVADRLRAFVRDHSSTDRIVVAVSHGDTIRAAARLLSAPPIELPRSGAILRLYAVVSDTAHGRPLTEPARSGDRLDRLRSPDAADVSHPDLTLSTRSPDLG